MVFAKVYKNVIKDVSTSGGCPVLNTAVESDDTNNLLKDRAAKAVVKWEKSISGLIRQGITAGEFKEQANIRQTSLSIIALIEGGVMIAKVTDDTTAMDSILKTVEVLVNQLLA